MRGKVSTCVTEGMSGGQYGVRERVPTAQLVKAEGDKAVGGHRSQVNDELTDMDNNETAQAHVSCY